MSKSLPLFLRRPRELCLIAALVTATACAGNYRLAPAAAPLSAGASDVSWFGPSVPSDARVLAKWRAGVGEPLVTSSSRRPTSAAIDGLTVVSWNIALGAGDVADLFHRLQGERPTHEIVLLIQEAYRGGLDVPLPALNAAFAARIRGAAGREIDDVAKALDLWAYYVPSMRNGAPGLSDQDRGNAILSTIPLTDLTAIELPFERQRRVAVAATVRGTHWGDPWALRVASVHLDNMAGLSRGYIGGEYARIRQARGLRDAFDGADPLILAGDFNTWFGFRDGAYRETSRAFPQTRITDERRTFMGLLRLDHVFYRLPQGWRAEVRRAESALGSDHHPLITTISF